MKRILHIAAFFCLLVGVLYSQCSDAGICSIPGSERTPSHRYSAGITSLYGTSAKAENITYRSIRFDASAALVEDIRLSVQLPFNAQSGPIGSVSGIGDAIAFIHYNVLTTDDYALSMNAGMKFTTGDANLNSSLPQQYQNGLGSTDLLLGLDGSAGIYHFALGYQFAGGRNSNAQTRLLRGDDLMVRIGTTIPADPLTFNISYLFVQRLGESSVRDTASPGNFISVPNSDQTQLNFVAEISVILSESMMLTSGIAFPFLKRSVNVDGLTRAFTISLGVQTVL